jgi:hypothetical protein
LQEDWEIPQELSILGRRGIRPAVYNEKYVKHFESNRPEVKMENIPSRIFPSLSILNDVRYMTRAMGNL